MRWVLAWWLFAGLSGSGCTDGGDDDDDFVGDDHPDAELVLLPCSSHTERDDAQVWTRAFAYDEEGRLSIERIEDDYPADGIADDVRLELHEYGENGVDTVTHDDGADCMPEYSFMYDRHGEPMSDELAYTFDERGNVLTAVGEFQDCAYEYDEHDNPVLEDCDVEVPEDDGSGGYRPDTRRTTWTWTYDFSGHARSLDKVQDAYAAEHWRWRWVDGLLIHEESWQDHRTGGHDNVAWTYDERRRLSTEVRDDHVGHSETTFSYDCRQPDDFECVPFRESTSTYSEATLFNIQGCGLHLDGALDCWGHVDLDPPLGTFTALSGQCAIRAEDGAVQCFDVSTSADAYQFTPPEGAFVALAGDCGLRADGTIACWGSLTYDGPPPQGTYSSLATGFSMACALDDEGHASCWGGPPRGEADVPDGEAFARISVAYVHGCGITLAGELVCWGTAPATDDGRYLDVAVGGQEQQTTCAIREDGTLACWGQLAPGPEGHFTRVEISDRAACAIRDDERLVCWGDNSNNRTSPP